MAQAETLTPKELENAKKVTLIALLASHPDQATKQFLSLTDRADTEANREEAYLELCRFVYSK